MRHLVIPARLDGDNFFSTILKKPVDEYQPGEDLILDFSACRWISSAVLTDLLVFAEELKLLKGIVPIVIMMGYGESARRIRKYLIDTQFVHYGRTYGIIDFDHAGFVDTDESGERSRMMPSYNVIRAYRNESYGGDVTKSIKDIKFDVMNRYAGLFQKFAADFSYVRTDMYETGPSGAGYEGVNIVQQLLVQLATNALTHGKRSVYVSVQGNRRDSDCTISVSDNGIGTMESMTQKLMEDEEISLMKKDEYMISDVDSRELVSCIEAFTYRFDESIYGLYNVMNEVTDAGGEIRFHTGRTQIVLNGQCASYIRDVTTRKLCAERIHAYIKENDGALIRTGKFCGTHIKIHIPTKLSRYE